MTWDFSILTDVSGWMVAAGIGLFVLRMVLKGKLVPQSVHNGVVHERDTWQQTALTALEANRLQAGLLEEARVALRANSAYLQALPRAEEDAHEQQH